MSDKREQEYSEFALTPPQMTALSDHPLAEGQEWVDRFNFPFQLGAIYDILRHPETSTPLTIGIYGDWGTGKTSAMKWLEGLLKTWNKDGDAKPKVKTIPVWFYPWKYQTREDVWRGIVAEIVLATMELGQASPERVLFAVKRFGAFLGKSFVRALSSVKLKAKDPTGVLGEGEVTFQAVEKILADFQDLNHPERPYLNRFESMLGNWLKASLGPNERLVLFIDDLDRCLPDVTLEVLEAIKLYLNIPGLIFVVGLDKEVVESIVLNHYEQRGVGQEKGLKYLAKMFQVDVHLFRMQQAVANFVDDQLSSFKIYDSAVQEPQKRVFKKFFSRYSGNSPREVKRVVNAAMIAARGWTTFPMGKGKEHLTFSEGLQRHFLRLRLRELKVEALLSSANGNEFLSQWSMLIHEFGAVEKYTQHPPTIDNISAKYSELPDAYQSLVKKFRKFFQLIGDRLLGDLLSVCKFRTSSALVAQEIQASIRGVTRRSSSSIEGRVILVCCSTSDQDVVDQIGQRLEKRGLRFTLICILEVMLTEELDIAEILRSNDRVPTVIIPCVGVNGMGVKEDNSVERFLYETLRSVFVLLPGAGEDSMPSWGNQFIDMRKGISHKNIEMLSSSISDYLEAS